MAFVGKIQGQSDVINEKNNEWKSFFLACGGAISKAGSDVLHYDSGTWKCFLYYWLCEVNQPSMALWGNPTFTNGFSWQRTSNAELWCLFCCQPAHALQQIVDLPVIGNPWWQPFCLSLDMLTVSGGFMETRAFYQICYNNIFCIFHMVWVKTRCVTSKLAMNQFRWQILVTIQINQKFLSAYNPLPVHQIATNFCTCHDSCAVVTCSKLCSNHLIKTWIKSKLWIHLFWTRIIWQSVSVMSWGLQYQKPDCYWIRNVWRKGYSEPHYVVRSRHTMALQKGIYLLGKLK